MTDSLTTQQVTSAEIRAHLRERSSATLRRRMTISRVMTVLCWLAISLAAVPLVALLIRLFVKGTPVLLKSGFFTQLPQQPTLFDQANTGGVSNAIVGSLAIIVYATLASIPIGIVVGIYTAESDSKFASTIRVVASTMVGAPSILMGLFAFGLIVVQLHLGFSILAGSFAVSVLMLPVLIGSTEIAVRNVPPTLREAGLALGAKPSTTSLRIVLPAATTGIVTGAILAISRAVGETAPVLLVIGGAYAITWKPNDPGSALPVTMYQDVASNFESLKEQAWGIGLLLVLVIFVLSFAARIWAARKQKVQR
ncbi:MAG: phosphate ABC transporter permease PstA [Actinomycetes bacterium]